MEKIDLASIYRDLSDAMQQETKEYKKIMEYVKEAAQQGKYSIRIRATKEQHWYAMGDEYYKDQLVKSLIDSGFECHSNKWTDKETTWLGFDRYYINISWEAKK